MKNSQHPKGALLLGKRFRSSDIACWDKWDRLFFNIRLLLSETQYSSDITSTIRIYRKVFKPPSQNSDSNEKSVWWMFLRKPNIGQKMRIFERVP